MIVLFEGPFGEEPGGDGVVVFVDDAAAALEGLFHEADFEAGGVGEFAADADEGAVLVEVIAVDVVAEVDEELSAAGVGEPGFGERDHAAGVAGLDGIVLDVGGAPCGGDFGISVDTELAHEAFDDAEEGDVGEEAVFGEIEEAVSAVWGEGAGDFDGERADGGIEFDLEGIGGFLGELGGIGEGSGWGSGFGVRCRGSGGLGEGGGVAWKICGGFPRFIYREQSWTGEGSDGSKGLAGG